MLSVESLWIFLLSYITGHLLLLYRQIKYIYIANLFLSMVVSCWILTCECEIERTDLPQKFLTFLTFSTNISVSIELGHHSYLVWASLYSAPNVCEDWFQESNLPLRDRMKDCHKPQRKNHVQSKLVPHSILLHHMLTHLMNLSNNTLLHQ